MCQALCQAASKWTWTVGVHASGRRKRAGGWQRAWARAAWVCRVAWVFGSDCVGTRRLSPGPVGMGSARRAHLCLPFSPLVAGISEWHQDPRPSQPAHGGRCPQGPGTGLAPLVALAPVLGTPFPGSASSLSPLLGISHSCPDPLMLVHIFPFSDGKTDAQMVPRVS